RQVKLMNSFRELWEQHVMWTRFFIISNITNLPELELVTNRLFRNPKDFANIFRLFFGNINANKFDELFTKHLLIAASLLNAKKAGNTEITEEERKKWFINADNIAALLAQLNKFWNKQEWQIMLYNHLKMTEDEAIQHLNGQYSSDIMLYDEIESQALKMADVMSLGIIRAFKI
ncbi:MAG: hypothetical protein K0S55_2071, partial [Clostridia bacterium]|nr:hypothetical protein [Clostridia bacterium]